jgi:hypothetical protein
MRGCEVNNGSTGVVEKYSHPNGKAIDIKGEGRGGKGIGEDRTG